jgi:hypothetical protein
MIIQIKSLIWIMILIVLRIIVNNNSIQFFIIYVPSQQPQGQLQTQHSTDIHNYIMDTYNIKARVNCRST